MISPHAVVQTGAIGAGTTIAEFAVVRPGTASVATCRIHPFVVIEAGVQIDDDVEVFPGAYLGKEPKGAGVTIRAVSFERCVRIGRGSSIGPHAVIYYDVEIGAETLVGDGASIREQSRVGSRCIISRCVTVNYNAHIGDRVRIMDSTHITGNCVIGDDVFISALVSTANDNTMSARHYDERAIVGPRIGNRVCIGEGACLLPGVSIGEGALRGGRRRGDQGRGAVRGGDGRARQAGGLAPKSDGVVAFGTCRTLAAWAQGGIPVPTERVPATVPNPEVCPPRRRPGREPVRGCRLLQLPRIADPRGNLSFVEGEEHVPFEIRRVYYLYDVPAGAERGGHAHSTLHQIIIPLAGSFDVILDDGQNWRRFRLDRPYRGLYISPLTWGELNNFTSGSVCLVLASAPFDEGDYIRHYGDFLRVARAAG